MTYVPIIDELACAGHGDCAALAPNIFEVDEIARVTGPGDEKSILAAARACPAGAITVIDAETGAVIFN